MNLPANRADFLAAHVNIGDNLISFLIHVERDEVNLAGSGCGEFLFAPPVGTRAKLLDLLYDQGQVLVCQERTPSKTP